MPGPKVRGASFANVMSVIAVFVAVGGTSYAAVALPRSSVGARGSRGSGEARRPASGSGVVSGTGGGARVACLRNGEGTG